MGPAGSALHEHRPAGRLAPPSCSQRHPQWSPRGAVPHRSPRQRVRMAHEPGPVPMAGPRAIGPLSRPIIHAHNGRDGAHRQPDFARTTTAVTQPQRPGEFALQRIAGQSRQLGIEGFGRAAPRRLIRRALAQAVGKLVEAQRGASTRKTAAHQRGWPASVRGLRA